MTIFSGHIIVLATGETGKVIDRSTDGRTLYVALVAFGKPGSGALRKVPAETARFATAEEIAGSVFANEFHLPAQKGE